MNKLRKINLFINKNNVHQRDIVLYLEIIRTKGKENRKIEFMKNILSNQNEGIEEEKMEKEFKCTQEKKNRKKGEGETKETSIIRSLIPLLHPSLKSTA